MNETLHELACTLRAAEDILLIAHVSPDGDTCGSALALRRALVSMGKQVRVACENLVPRIYADLDGAETVCAPEAWAGHVFDLAVAVDVSDVGRLGACAALFDAARDTAQIDHHATNPGYARINCIRSPLSATGVLVGELLELLGVPLDMPTARCLFVAVATDTGNFKQFNTDAAALHLAARCVEAGIDVSDISRRVFDLRPLAQTRLIGRALESMEILGGGSVAVMRLTQEDFDRCGALGEHTEGIINFGINTEGVAMACLLSQRGDAVKGSMRSLRPYNVARVAMALGGGGHEQAAGFTCKAPMEDVCARVQQLLLAERERHG